MRYDVVWLPIICQNVFANLALATSEDKKNFALFGVEVPPWV